MKDLTEKKLRGILHPQPRLVKEKRQREEICCENEKFSKTENFRQMEIEKVFQNALPVLPEMLP